jgi:hypothetical protein
MLWYLVAHQNGEVKDTTISEEIQHAIVALGLGEWTGSGLGIVRPSMDKPDFSSVIAGDTAKLTLEKIPVMQGDTQPIDPSQQLIVVSVEDITHLTLSLEQTIAEKLRVRYRIERVTTAREPDQSDIDAMAAANPGCTVIKAKLPWYIGPRKLILKNAQILDPNTGDPVYGAIYY